MEIMRHYPFLLFKLVVSDKIYRYIVLIEEAYYEEERIR